MLRYGFLAGSVATLALGFLAIQARAGDTVRLVIGGGSSPSVQLTAPDADTADDTLLIRGWHHHHHGYYHAYYHSYYYPHAYATFSYGYYRPYYRSYYYPTYYYPRAYYYYAPPIWDGCYRISLGGGALLSDRSEGGGEPAPHRSLQPLPDSKPGFGGDGTFPYDGGPRSPIPQPKGSDPAPSASPKPSLPLDGKPVSLPAPAKPSQFAYSAYGEDMTKKPAKPSSFAQDRQPTKDTRTLVGK